MRIIDAHLYGECHSMVWILRRLRLYATVGEKSDVF